MIGFLFPGQGAQTPGMGEQWKDRPEWRLAEIAAEVTGVDVPWLLTEADEFELVKTPHAQIAVMVTSLMAWQALSNAGVAPMAVAGHSLGEYTALAAAGALSLDQSFWLIAARGHAMAHACEQNPGTMMAIHGLEDEHVQIAVSRAIENVWISNYNALGQTVIAGNLQAVEAAAEHCEAAGGQVTPLPVEGAFHTPYMSPAKPALVDAMAQMTWFDASAPVYTNIDATPHTSAGDWTGLLASHLCNPVRWRQTLFAMRSNGVKLFVTIGHADSLARFSAKNGTGAIFVTVDHPDKIDSVLEAIARVQDDSGSDALARLASMPPPPKNASRPTGERAHLTERLVCALTSGKFEPAEGVATGTHVSEGQVIGTVNDEPVYSPHEGVIVGVIATTGERIKKNQPLAWLRPAHLTAKSPQPS